MPELPPALSGIAVTVVAGCLYVAIWHATRGLEGTARVLARAAPVVIVPCILYFSVVLCDRRDAIEAEPVVRQGAATAPARPAREAAATRTGTAPETRP